MQATLRSGLKSVKSSVFSRSNSNAPVNLQPNHFNPERPESIKRLADAVKEKSALLEPQTGSLNVYKILLKEEQDVSGCKCFSFGEKSTKRNRTVVIFGAPGAEQSALINGMINYVLGVEWEDLYRFKLVEGGQLGSPEVTVYKVHHQEGFQIDHSLTIINTPGVGDPRGIEKTADRLSGLFSADCAVSEIDAVCFVAQAALARLTPTHKYMFDSVLSVFGKDVAQNFRLLVTFADGKRPPVLEAIKSSGVPCPKTKDGLPVYFKFNNSALFVENKSPAEDGGFDQMFWDIGTKGMKTFFADLNIIDTKSLQMTREVLRERWQLENLAEIMQKQVRVAKELAKRAEIKEANDRLKDLEAKISRNEKFETESSVQEAILEDICGTSLCVCRQCKFICHNLCRIPSSEEKRQCWMMRPDNRCSRCPDKCSWDQHFSQLHTAQSEEVKKKRTLEKRKQKHKTASEAKKQVQAQIEKCEYEYELVQAEVEKLEQSCAESLNGLREFALMPAPLSSPGYINMLTEEEKSEARPGWRQRLQSLMVMKEKAEILTKVERGEKLLWRTLTDSQCCRGQTKSKANHDDTETPTKRLRLD